MKQKIIALDAMGGDHGPVVTVPAAKMALNEISGLKLILVGDSALLMEALKANGLAADSRISIQHASEVVGMAEAPALALKKKKDSSMRVAINLVKEHKVQACVSAGNTGALMATSKFVLKTIKGISRPAICGMLPAITGQSYMLDLGANVESTTENLLEVAGMGQVLAHAVDVMGRATAGLLDIG